MANSPVTEYLQAEQLYKQRLEAWPKLGPQLDAALQAARDEFGAAKKDWRSSDGTDLAKRDRFKAAKRRLQGARQARREAQPDRADHASIAVVNNTDQIDGYQPQERI